jgi:hypothetical protein
MTPRQQRRPLLTTVALFAAVALAAPAGASSSSHVLYWKNKHDTYDCGVKVHPKGTKPTLLVCSADAVPQSPTAPKDGDPAVQLGTRGKPKLIESYDSTFASHHQVALKTNSTWSDFGVTCKIGAKNVTCTNRDKHGFTTGHATFKTF